MGAYRFVVSAVIAVCAGALMVGTPAADKSGLHAMTPRTATTRAEGAMPELDGAVDWLNSTPLSAADLRGKVVLIDFWTYSCINWQRTLPYVRAWAAEI